VEVVQVEGRGGVGGGEKEEEVEEGGGGRCEMEEGSWSFFPLREKAAERFSMSMKTPTVSPSP